MKAAVSAKAVEDAADMEAADMEVAAPKEGESIGGLVTRLWSTFLEDNQLGRTSLAEEQAKDPTLD